MSAPFDLLVHFPAFDSFTIISRRELSYGKSLRKSGAWVDRKSESEGSVPLLEPDHSPNGWTSPSGDVFKVRGPEYITTKAKIPGGDYLLRPLGLTGLKDQCRF
ncbi:unnamed protein product [Fraxinus pennsylvanica]|uniref:Protein ENHANCED DISEASE RESISTANCE 2 C-terminal domain-containing protein n=1 Tax=Fraxinus pennsylvanica TaxID=56036 RepID=A0AAD2DQ32_9LAMI|nr:unnamed protein product [Fraxinus pennsylvanica]